MEKLLDPYDKECMKMAMLKHEETFRQQVCELHRLYRIQKILMKRIDTSRPPQRTPTLERLNSHHHQQNHPKLLSVDLERPAGKERRLEIERGIENDDEETEIELTLGPSSYHRNKKGDKKSSRNSGSGKSFSSSSTTGSSSSHMKGKNNRSFDVEQQQQQQQFMINQERLKQPSWLFQPLSLNMS